MVQIEMSKSFPVPPSTAFAYITDLKNWKEYWPGFVRINALTNARWRGPGDTVILVIRLLGREVELRMTLTEFRQDTLVRYRSSQSGLPEAQHERRWKAVSDGCEYQIIVSFEPRLGFAGLFDRFVFKRSVRNAVRQTLENLDTIFKQTWLEGYEKRQII
jgi:hypothetical protein